MDVSAFDHEFSPRTGQPPPPPPLPPAPRRRRGRGWMVLSLVLAALLAVSVLLNIGGLLGSALKFEGAARRTAGPRLDEVVIEPAAAEAKVAVIPVEGVISGQKPGSAGHSMVDVIRAQLRRAADDAAVRAVVLKVDSPGGEVLASDEIYQMIDELQTRHGKPVVASMGSLAASGGYYVAAPCRWITASELTITGSIGVILSTWNYRDLMGKVGIRPFTYKSGRFKDMLSGSRDAAEIPAEEREMIQSLIDRTFERFRTVVEVGRTRAATANDGRGRALVPNWRDFADGRIVSGREAFELGFVDELGGMQAALARARELSGIDAAKVVEYRPRHDFAELFGLFGQAGERSVKIDLGVEVPRLEPGRLYFLAPCGLD